jgi:hypothetical protein
MNWSGFTRTLPLLVLLAISASDLFRSAGAASDSWRGSSFGMFAYVPKGFLRCYIESNTGIRACAIPEELELPSRRAHKLPTHSHLTALSKELANAQSPSSIAGADAEVLRLEYWEYEFYPEASMLRPRRLAAVKTSLDSDG